MTNYKHTVIRVDAKPYEDCDDCLAAAAAVYSDEHDLEGYDIEARWADEDNDRSAILLTVPSPDKSDVSQWESVASYVATYPSDGEDGACDVEVQIGEARGCWFVRTRDDAGGSDDAGNATYASEDEARTAAEEFAAENNEAEDGENAEDYLRGQTEGRVGDGEWVSSEDE